MKTEMMHILDRLTTTILQSLDDDVPAKFWSNLHTSYYTRCPFTGKTMTTPYMDKNGISYERDLILLWLRDPNNELSPISGQRLKVSDLRPNRSIGNMIELIPKGERVDQDQSIFDLMFFRYQFLLYSFCKLKSTIDAAASNEIRQRIKLYDIQDDKWWPVVHDKDFVCGLIWTAFPRLRQMVYGEFSQIVNPSIAYNMLPGITNHKLKEWAKYCMVDAMKAHFNESKASQIDIAINAFRSSNRYVPHRKIDTERKERWCKEFDILLPTHTEAQVQRPQQMHNPPPIELQYMNTPTPQNETHPFDWR